MAAEPSRGHPTAAHAAVGRVLCFPAESTGAKDAPRFRASVILVSRDRCDELETALDSVARQSTGYGGFEVLVVDDGSGDRTWERLSERVNGGRSGNAARLLAIRVDRSVGPGAARQLASERAHGDALVFLDSDCRALPGWLDALLRELDRPGVAIVGGAEVLDPGWSLRERVLHFVLTSPLTTGGLRGSSGWKAGRYRPRGFNMAVRREAFDRAGGFADWRRGEDIDLSQRVGLLGLDSTYVPDAQVFHRRRRSFAAFWRQVYAMGRARVDLIQRHLGNLEPAYLLPGLILLGLPVAAATAVVLPETRPFLVGSVLLGGLYLLLIGMRAAFQLGDGRALVLAPFVFVIQVAGYGTGLLSGVFEKMRGPRGEAGG